MTSTGSGGQTGWLKEEESRPVCSWEIGLEGKSAARSWESLNFRLSSLNLS